MSVLVMVSDLQMTFLSVLQFIITYIIDGCTRRMISIKCPILALKRVARIYGNQIGLYLALDFRVEIFHCRLFHCPDKWFCMQDQWKPVLHFSCFYHDKLLRTSRDFEIVLALDFSVTPMLLYQLLSGFFFCTYLCTISFIANLLFYCTFYKLNKPFTSQFKFDKCRLKQHSQLTN